MGFGDRVFGEFVEGEGYGFFELRVMAFRDGLGVLFDGEVGLDAAVFDVPLASRGELAEVG